MHSAHLPTGLERTLRGVLSLTLTVTSANLAVAALWGVPCSTPGSALGVSLFAAQTLQPSLTQWRRSFSNQAWRVKRLPRAEAGHAPPVIQQNGAALSAQKIEPAAEIQKSFVALVADIPEIPREHIRRLQSTHILFVENWPGFESIEGLRPGSVGATLLLNAGFAESLTRLEFVFLIGHMLAHVLQADAENTRQELSGRDTGPLDTMQVAKDIEARADVWGLSLAKRAGAPSATALVNAFLLKVDAYRKTSLKPLPADGGNAFLESESELLFKPEGSLIARETSARVDRNGIDLSREFQRGYPAFVPSTIGKAVASPPSLDSIAYRFSPSPLPIDRLFDGPILTLADTYLAGAVRLRGGWRRYQYWRALRSFHFKNRAKQLEYGLRINAAAFIPDQLTPGEREWIELEFAPVFESGNFWELHVMERFIDSHPLTPDERQIARSVGYGILESVTAAAVPGFARGVVVTAVGEVILSLLLRRFVPGADTLVTGFWENPLVVAVPILGGLIAGYLSGRRSAIVSHREYRRTHPNSPALSYTNIPSPTTQWATREIGWIRSLMNDPATTAEDYARLFNETWLPAKRSVFSPSIQRILNEGLADATEYGRFGTDGPTGHPYGLLLAGALFILKIAPKSREREKLVATWEDAIRIYNQSSERTAATGPLSAPLLMSLAVSVLVSVSDEEQLTDLAKGLASLPEPLRLRASSFHLFQLGIHLANDLGDEQVDFKIADSLGEAVRLGVRRGTREPASKNRLEIAWAAMLLSAGAIARAFLPRLIAVEDADRAVSILQRAREKDRTALVPLTRFTLGFGTEMLALNRHFSRPADELLLENYWDPAVQRELDHALRSEPQFSWASDPGRGTPVADLDARYPKILDILEPLMTPEKSPRSAFSPRTSARLLRRQA